MLTFRLFFRLGSALAVALLLTGVPNLANADVTAEECEEAWQSSPAAETCDFSGVTASYTNCTFESISCQDGYGGYVDTASRTLYYDAVGNLQNCNGVLTLGACRANPGPDGP